MTVYHSPGTLAELEALLQKHRIDYQRWVRPLTELFLDIEMNRVQLCETMDQLYQSITTVSVRVLYKATPRARKRRELYMEVAPQPPQEKPQCKAHWVAPVLCAQESGRVVANMIGALLRLEIDEVLLRADQFQDHYTIYGDDETAHYFWRDE